MWSPRGVWSLRGVAARREPCPLDRLAAQVSGAQIKTRALLNWLGRTLEADVTPAAGLPGTGGLVNGLFLYRGGPDGFENSEVRRAARGRPATGEHLQ